MSSDSSKLKYWNMLKSSTYCTVLQKPGRSWGRSRSCDLEHERGRTRAAGPWCRAAAHRPIQVAKRCGTYAATLLSRLICTYRESMALTLRLVVCAVRTVCFDVKHKEDASTTLSCRQFCILVLFLKVSSSVPVMLAQMTIRLMT